MVMLDFPSITSTSGFLPNKTETDGVVGSPPSVNLYTPERAAPSVFKGLLRPMTNSSTTVPSGLFFKNAVKSLTSSRGLPFLESMPSFTFSIMRGDFVGRKDRSAPVSRTITCSGFFVLRASFQDLFVLAMPASSVGVVLGLLNMWTANDMKPTIGAMKITPSTSRIKVVDHWPFGTFKSLVPKFLPLMIGLPFSMSSAVFISVS
eukprot:06353_2